MIEQSAASAFAGQDVPDWLLTECSPADNWRPHLAAGTLWVMEHEGEAIAFMAATIDARRLHIDEIDVTPGHQGQGIGRRLLEAAADWARAKGLSALSLTTFRNIPWNAPFYARVGFREWDPIDAPESINHKLVLEAEMGLTDRCAMRMDL